MVVTGKIRFEGIDYEPEYVWTPMSGNSRYYLGVDLVSEQPLGPPTGILYYTDTANTLQYDQPHVPEDYFMSSSGTTVFADMRSDVPGTSAPTIDTLDNNNPLFNFQ